jgi:subtilisin family serine protease
MIESPTAGWAAVPGMVGIVPPRTTGRYVVVFGEEDDPGTVLGGVAGLSEIAYSRDFEVSAMDMAETASADARVFSELGMAVVQVDPDQATALRSAEGARGHVLAVAPELVHHVLDGRGYLEGYRDGVDDVVARAVGRSVGRGASTGEGPGPAQFHDTDEATWGLQATRVLGSRATGSGVRVAVLDTGMDLAHPDFVGRAITSQSFIAGEDAQDGHGHGTHCVGTACGPRSPMGSRRYGLAYEAEVYVGKVLSNQGSGDDSGILAGIDWAVTNGCAVISMSLGADVAEPHPPYVVAGRRALSRGSLIVAAAGNNANRPGDPGFVGVPANSPDILAVAALDSELDIAPFSARSLPGRGGQVDIAGPGVAVYSCWPMPTRYRTISGTSMATPHVAGIAALLAQSTGRRGLELWATLVKEGQRLGLPSVDVGAGLVLAQS